MSSGNALTARIGLDATDYKKELQTVQKATMQAQKQMETGAKTWGVESKKAGKTATDAHKAPSSGGTRAAGDLLNMATASSGAVNELNILTHTLGLPLAGGIGLAVAIGVMEKLKAATEAVTEANEEAKKEIGKNLSAQSAAGPESTKHALEAKSAAIDKLQNSRGKLSEAADSVSSMFGNPGQTLKVFGLDTGIGGGANLKSLQLQKRLEQDRVELLVKSAGLVREETAGREKATYASTEELELLNLQVKTRQKLAQIELDSPVGMAASAKEQVRSEAAIEEAKIKRVAAAKKDDLYLERRLTEIRKDGANVEIESARVKLMTAKALLNLAVTDEAKSEGQNGVAAAQVDYDMAVRTRAELNAQLKVQKQIAEMVAAPQEKQRAQLEGDRELLKERLKNAKPDERPKIEVELAVNEAQWRAFNQGLIEKQRRIAGSDAEAGTGRGEAEQLRAMREKLDRGKKALEQDKKNPEMDPEALAAARAQLVALEHTYLDISEARDRGVQHAKDDAQIMQLELAHNPIMAQALRTQLDFREKIRQANKDGNTELAAQLQKQMQLTLAAQAQALAMKREGQAHYTIGELASEGRGGTRSKARRAEREARLGRMRGMAGDEKGALRHYDRSNKIKQGINALNFADRQSAKEMTGALDASKVLKNIETATSKFVIKML